ncbi:Uncharacterized protein DBV15_03041 [Temnothorax longispinosus]|uniref:Uncharacterized protein n=1 Tax=Temnothorax longispinosus TaxID=300112 RepID=A0A4S2KCP1_9HYME|nr:Uncharacterized protein DBV15_03041 [Temnothorax longispinosus]
MHKQHKIKSHKKMSKNRPSKISVKSNNLSLSTSNVNSTAKSKCMLSTISLATPNKNYKSSMTVKKAQFSTKAPKNAAVHFGNFYGLWDDVGKTYCNNHFNNRLIKEETAIKRPHRLEFTRQMVNKLERATDAEDYMRQVSVLLKKTVEPPDFRLNQLPSRNSIPNGSRSSSDYPLWYKEPHKISLVFSNPIAQLKA